MAGDNRFRRLVKFWWVLAFVLGATLGTVSAALLGPRDTIVIITSVGIICAVMVALIELGVQPSQRTTKALTPGWRKPAAPIAPSLTAKPRKGKPEARRAQLHAITGRKIADPPSRS